MKQLKCGKKRKNNYKGSVIILLIFITLIAIFCRVVKVQAEDVAGIKIQAIKEVHAQVLDKNEQLIRDNDELKAKLDASSRIETSETTKALVRAKIKQYFGDKAAEAEKVFTCESGLNNMVVNTRNTNGSVDRGVPQINSIHAKRFKEMYGIDYNIGAHDIDLSLQYAKFLYDHQGWTPWVCRYILTR